jgi:putative colanic acid biosynthesis acetyltransferase WcaF
MQEKFLNEGISMKNKKYIDLTTYKTPDGFRGKSGWFVQLWWIVQATVFRHSPRMMNSFRAFLLRCFGADVGKNVLIRPSATFTYPWKIKIGDCVWIGDDVVVYSLGPISIGNNVVVSQKSYLCAASHDVTKESFDIFAKPVVIEDESWLATDVFVSPGVTIHRGVVVGARSSVFNDLPAGMICVGSPARPVRPRVFE